MDRIAPSRITLARTATLFAAVLGALGCAGLLGVEDWEGSAASGGATAGAGTGAGGKGGASTSASSGVGQGGASCDRGFECVPPLPTGWTKLARTNTSAYPNPSSPMCPSGGLPETFVGTPTNAVAVCNPCACGAPTGTACNFPTVTVYNNNQGCVDDSGTNIDDSQNGTCLTLQPRVTDANGSAAISAPSQSTGAGSCAPSGGGLLSKPPAWTHQIDVCPVAVEPEECGLGGVCIATGSGSYNGPACVVRTEDVPCPPEYPNKLDGQPAYTTENDGRMCSACGCNGPQNVSCTPGSYIVWDNDGCAAAWAAFTDVACHDISAALGDSNGSVSSAPGMPTGGMCAATGGPTGAVVGVGATTICCL